jgi:hypothetical protein
MYVQFSFESREEGVIGHVLPVIELAVVLLADHTLEHRPYHGVQHQHYVNILFENTFFLPVFY